jgi:predicted RNase H-related nuclease YkuK (DUF458 family)
MSFETEVTSLEGWKSPGDKEELTLDCVFAKIKSFATDPNYLNYEYDLGIGTDSQMIGSKFQFISVISAHRKGKGGLYYYHKSFEVRAKFPVENQKMRMFHEVGRSIELAYAMQNMINMDPIVHVDASPPRKQAEFTAKFSEQLRGYVQGCGFNCMLKPESYVAHAIADRHTKKRTRKRRRQQHKQRFGQRPNRICRRRKPFAVYRRVEIERKQISTRRRKDKFKKTTPLLVSGLVLLVVFLFVFCIACLV